jgi:hypothetical protein
MPLGGTGAQAYGFKVNADGLGAYSWGIGSNGTAFGVANNTVSPGFRPLGRRNEGRNSFPSPARAGKADGII